jgi:hypothetical protein
MHDKSVVSYELGHSNNNDLVFKNVIPVVQALKDDVHFYIAIVAINRHRSNLNAL